MVQDVAYAGRRAINKEVRALMPTMVNPTVATAYMDRVGSIVGRYLAGVDVFMRGLPAPPAVGPTNRGLQAVLFVWSDKYGQCRDCKCPAAYRAHRWPNRRSVGDAFVENEWANLCCVCAADDASEGTVIVRLEPQE